MLRIENIYDNSPFRNAIPYTNFIQYLKPERIRKKVSHRNLSTKNIVDQKPQTLLQKPVIFPEPEAERKKNPYFNSIIGK